MEISGKRMLDINDYNAIIVSDEIHVYGSVQKDTFNCGNKFTETLNGKNDEEVRKEVIKYFIDNHKISSIEYKSPFEVFCSLKSYIIKSTGGIILKVDTEHMTEDILREIYLKYCSDRFEYLSNTDTNYYLIRSNDKGDIDSMYMKGLMYEERYLSLPSYIDKENVTEMFLNKTKIDEETFLYLIEQIDNAKLIDTYEDNNVFEVVKNNKNVYFDLDENLSCYIFKLIEEKSNIKRKSLKLEEFK